MKLIVGFLDRICFTAGVLVFLQLPHFIDQYTQRFGGYYGSEQQHIAEYQANADENFKGSLDKLIQAFKSSNSTAVHRIGKKIEKDAARVRALRADKDILEKGNLLNKLLFLATDLDFEIAKGTMQSFKPGVPFTTDALICAVFGGITFSLVFNFLFWLPKLIVGKLVWNQKLSKA